MSDTDDTDDASDRSSGARVRLELSTNPASIAVARAVIRRIVTFRDPNTESSFLVAFTEIMANAVDEHVRVSCDAPIVIEIEDMPDDVVRVSDSGSGVVEPEAMTSSTPDVSVERGRGLALARAFVDGLHIESSPSGTIVTLPLAGFGIIR